MAGQQARRRRLVFGQPGRRHREIRLGHGQESVAAPHLAPTGSQRL